MHRWVRRAGPLPVLLLRSASAVTFTTGSSPYLTEPPLEARTSTELQATGGRPRNPIRTGRDALTPIEQHAASLAEQGMSNPQIAQTLFISRKTVEKRFSETYRKLNINSRHELAAVLTTPTASPGTGTAVSSLPAATPRH
jgi:DNA-binding CsgD family transcriptional regulator